MATTIIEQIEQIPSRPRGRPPKPKTDQPTIKNMPLQEYRKMYYEKTKQPRPSKKLNKTGLAHIHFLRTQGYSFSAIAKTLGKSQVTVSEFYRKQLLLNPDYPTSKEYEYYKQYIGQVPFQGPDIV